MRVRITDDMWEVLEVSEEELMERYGELVKAVEDSAAADLAVDRELKEWRLQLVRRFRSCQEVSMTMRLRRGVAPDGVGWVHFEADFFTDAGVVVAAVADGKIDVKGDAK